MVKYEIRSYYENRVGGIGHLDKECSVPVSETTEELAAQYQQLLEGCGYRRHETSTQVFYDKRTDARHCEEVIFYKEGSKQ